MMPIDTIIEDDDNTGCRKTVDVILDGLTLT